MSTARTAKGQGATPPGQRTDEIRQVAAQLFHERGYSSTTMAQIAEAVGVFPGSLYHHFASKEEIAIELLDESDRDLADTAARFAAAPTHVEDTAATRVERLAHEVMQASMRHAAATCFRIYEPPSVASERLHAARAGQVPAAEKLWKSTVDDLDPPESKAGFAPLVRSTLRSLAMQAPSQFPQDANLKEMASGLTGLILHGIALSAPDDLTLDDSAPVSAVRAVVAQWPEEITPSAENDAHTQVIAAARQEFAKRGYDSTTIRDIADAAGIRMGTLYRRVASKEAILVDILAGYTPHFGAAIEAALNTPSASEVENLDALALAFNCARRRFRAESDILRLSWIHSDAIEPVRQYHLASQRRLAILEGLIERGIERGTLRRVGPTPLVARFIRYIGWTPLQDFGRTSDARAHQFLRATMLRGYLNE